MINEIIIDAEKRMKKTVESLQHEMTKIRTGRANAGLLDHVFVDYYGCPTPLNQVASVNTSDSRTLLVTPFEKSMVAAIEKAILTADLGLNPSSVGAAIRVPMPAMTEDRRREMTRVVRGEAEGARVSVRNIRREANNTVKGLVKDKLLSEDDEHRANDLVQTLTDKYIAELDVVLADKERDLMQV